MVDGAKPRCARVEGFPLHANVGVQLGHANPSTTLRHYAKWIPSQGRRWVEVLDRADWSAGLEIGTKIWNQTGPNLQVVAQAIEKLGEPSGTRTRDPLIKSPGRLISTRYHRDVSARENETAQRSFIVMGSG